MPTGDLILWLSLMVLFLVVNGLFVAVEFALVAIRKTRIQELLDAGHPQAKLLARLKDNIDLSVSGMQLGITLASIALGWIGEHSIAELVKSMMDKVPGLTGFVPPPGIGIVVSFLILSILHVVLGEQVPKVLALRMPERMLMILARPYDLYQKATYPLIWLMTFLTSICLRMLRVKPAGHDGSSVVTAEELEILIDESHKAGELDARETDLLKRVFSLRDLTVEQVMISRAGMDSISESATLAEVLKIVGKTKHSKLPVYAGPEKVVGVLYTRDLFDVLGLGIDASRFKLASFVRPVYQVKTTDNARVVLDDMRTRRIQIAVVADESGKLKGLVTMEDLLERLVGDIFDEYDKLPTKK